MGKHCTACRRSSLRCRRSSFRPTQSKHTASNTWNASDTWNASNTWNTYTGYGRKEQVHGENGFEEKGCEQKESKKRWLLLNGMHHSPTNLMRGFVETSNSSPRRDSGRSFIIQLATTTITTTHNCISSMQVLFLGTRCAQRLRPKYFGQRWHSSC